jgi:hypothetical protein
MAVATLKDFQFEVGGYIFGNGRKIFVDQAGFKPAGAEWVTQDQDNPSTGATMFGRDVVRAPEWSWMLHVDTTTAAEALDEFGKMAAAWRNGATGFRDARAVVPLRYRVGGRTRVIYGRPRRLDVEPDSRIGGGYLAPSASFQKADSLHYEDVESVVDVRLAPPVSGGMTWPAVFPLTFRRDPGYVPPEEVKVGGNAETAPIVTFYGPVTDPSMTVGGFVLGLKGTIGYGGSVTIDARPWVQAVTRAGDAGAVILSRDTRITRARLAPGSYDAVFRGVDSSGGARCRVIWRNAWHSL